MKIQDKEKTKRQEKERKATDVLKTTEKQRTPKKP